ncbi:sensor histidine kinase [Acutalibacter caecimuris]|uniref:sensor histidine kinase n=1 Tax=Acutalibacter caecimuris TaxID=3093657 RepID=UPI002AC90E36|nr:HAMP domain-containing sensor histidine kinase [Acutalibacter sp. M00118]
MFQGLRRQMTRFCILATVSIALAITLLCLMVSENAIRQAQYQAFLNDVNGVISYLEGRTVISGQWLAQTEGAQQLLLAIYDNAEPLAYNGLKTPRESLERQAQAIAAENCGLNVLEPSRNSVLTQTVRFNFRDEDGMKYYGAAVVFPRPYGSLGALILCPLEQQEKQIFHQRAMFAVIVFTGAIALAIFAWFFTGKMLIPLEESQRKQAQFVASASHELRSPLTVMLSNLSALEKAGPDEQARFRENIRAEGHRMSRLIDDMLALANADSHSWSLQRTPVALDTLTLDIYERFCGPAREKGIQFSAALPEEDIPLFPCDPDRITQALAVLLDNALSYTPTGGSVGLRLARQANGRYCFSVADTGPGIPDREKENIFLRFYRCDASRQDREHFGLGLCVAREIAGLHRGRLWVEDAPGGGAVFHLLL